MGCASQFLERNAVMPGRLRESPHDQRLLHRYCHPGD